MRSKPAHTFAKFVQAFALLFASTSGAHPKNCANYLGANFSIETLEEYSVRGLLLPPRTTGPWIDVERFTASNGVRTVAFRSVRRPLYTRVPQFPGHVRGKSTLLDVVGGERLRRWLELQSVSARFREAHADVSLAFVHKTSSSWFELNDIPASFWTLETRAEFTRSTLEIEEVLGDYHCSHPALLVDPAGKAVLANLEDCVRRRRHQAGVSFSKDRENISWGSR